MNQPELVRPQLAADIYGEEIGDCDERVDVTHRKSIVADIAKNAAVLVRDVFTDSDMTNAYN